LLTQPTLINKRKRALLPVILQRQTLADGFARYLSQLGLERRIKTKTLNDILNEDTKPEDHHGKGGRAKAMSQADTISFVSEALTEFQGHPERCSNPFCDAPMATKNKHAPVKLFCCDRCRMDGYVLRRARAMLDEVGIVEFKPCSKGQPKVK
jgi:hypothetical protein